MLDRRPKVDYIRKTGDSDLEKKQKPSFSKFGKDFQETLCQMILLDRPFADQIMEVLDINFWNSTTSASLFVRSLNTGRSTMFTRLTRS